MTQEESYIDGLVEKAQDGDIDKFSVLYDELLNPVYRFCFFRLPSKELAEDVTSEVFISVWNNLKKYNKEKGIKFTAWVFRIAKNKIIDFFRRNKDTLELKEELEMPDPLAEKSYKKIENDFLKKALQKALENIPKTQSEALILKYFSQLENKEIAEVMDKSETAIRILQSRGLKTIRTQLPELAEYL